VRKLLILACLFISCYGIALAASPAVVGVRAPSAVAVADLNKDGIPDLVTGSASGLFVQLGIGDGTLQLPVQVSGSSALPESYFRLTSGTSIVFGDFNADGNPDILFVACTRGGCSLAVLLGNGDGTFQPQREYDPSGALGGIAVGDFNGDGILDIALANYANAAVDLLLGNGDGTFQPARSIARAGASSLAAADLSGDGRLDLVVADWDASTVQLLRNDGRGNFKSNQPLATGPNPGNVILADLRGTGRFDILTLDANQSVSALLSNADGTYEPAATVYAVAQASLAGLAVADIYGSGVPALFVADQASASVQILAGNGDGTFQDPVSIPAGATPSALAVADVNHDGRPDLIVASRRGNATTVLLNQALWTAALPHALASAIETRTVFAADFGGDHFSARSRAVPRTASAAPTLSISALPGTTIPWGKPLLLRVTLSGSAATRAPTALYSVDNGPAGALPLAAGSTTISIPQLSVGAHAIIVTHGKQANYAVLQAQSLTITVTQATPTLTWANPAPIPYGAALSATQLNATAPIAGTFAYSPAAGAVLTAGSQTLSVTFTPNDSTDYTTAAATVTLTVNPATPAITWPAPASIPYGTALSAIQLDAASPIAGVFTYTPAAGAVLTAGAQTLSVAFTPNDTEDYNAASATVKLTVAVAKPVITWTAPASIAYGTALSATQLDATSPVAGTFVYNPALGTVLSVGSHSLSVTFTPTDTVDYSTATATVTELVGPNIEAQPASLTVILGHSAVFSITATGAGPLRYQWQYWTGTTWAAYTAGTGCTSSSMITAATTAAVSGTRFRALVTDANGVSAASNAATLTVSPIITTQPAAQSVPVGNTASFIVAVAGAPNLSYQWQYLSGSTWCNVTTGSGANTATFTTQPTAVTDNYTEFRVVTTDGNGLTVTSNQVRLTVTPAILTQPTSQTANDGSSSTFTVVATGVPGLVYRWKYWTGTAWANYTAGLGYESPTMTIHSATVPLNGLQLEVVVIDGDGISVASNPVTLSVAPAITTQPTHQTEPVKWAATFTVVAAGVPTLTYQWQYLDLSAWVPFTKCAVCNAATLVTNANKITDNGTQLRVVVTDGNGLTVTSNTVTLTVIL